jgi:hypothetical protein
MSIAQAWHPCRVSSCILGYILLYSILMNDITPIVFSKKERPEDQHLHVDSGSYSY